MPIYRMLGGRAFDPETVKMLGQCFEAILKELKLTVRGDPRTTLIAKRVTIEFFSKVFFGQTRAALLARTRSRPRQRLLGDGRLHQWPPHPR